MATEQIPAEFQQAFRSLVVALQPRDLGRDSVNVYWAALEVLPVEALARSAVDLTRRTRFFPTTGEWFEAALLYVKAAPVAADRHRRIETARAAAHQHEGTRRLEELDDLAPNDPERDEICKGLSRDDQRALMARYGFTW